MTHWFDWRISKSMVLSVFLVGGGAYAWAQGGIEQEGDSTVFRTGSLSPLLTYSLPLTIPGAAREPVLEFEFGFATEEVVAPNTFFDSFSVTLQPAEASHTALLLTADATGLVTAPNNPGGLPLDIDDLDLQSVAFPDLSPTLDLQSAFRVSYSLPGVLTDVTATLYFDLADNLDALASLAYVTAVRIASLPPTGPPANLQVWSARQPAGPYVPETQFQVDATNQVIRLIPEGGQGFFRTRSTIRTRLIELRSDEEDWIASYAFDPEVLIVESASEAAGPYAPVTPLNVDVATQTLIVPRLDEFHFFRVRSDAAAEISLVRVEADRLVLGYEIRADVTLMSAAQCVGPYSRETVARNDPEAREIRVGRGGSVRFLRLSAEVSLRIVSVRTEGHEVVLGYETL